MKNFIGLDAEQSKTLAGMLNDLLANFQLFYINTRGFHWNITGERFFELHAKFEELYNFAEKVSDEGTVALMSDYIRQQEKQVWMYSAFLR